MAKKKKKVSERLRRPRGDGRTRSRKTVKSSHRSQATGSAEETPVSIVQLSSAELRARRSRWPLRRSARLEAEVRMYSPGLGDCFLLTFREGVGAAVNECHVLIDCGVFIGTQGGAERIRKIAANIAEATRGHLHVLALTHEHWDHLSGFIYANELFKTRFHQIDRVWLAWTEDPSDPLANRLRQRRREAGMALHSVALKMDAETKQLRGLLGFIGGDQEELAVTDANDLRSTSQVLQWASEHRANNDGFLRPGKPPLKLPGIEGVRVYVLGPPEDREALEKSNPSSLDPETYHLSLDNVFYEATFANGFAARPEAASDLNEQAMPFPAGLRQPLDDLPNEPLDVSRVYEHDGDRQIKKDWLSTAERLALKLDSDTNNTSLVLAFEFIHSGKVLLFPGDAQVGNWLSWQDHAWEVPSAIGTRAVTAEDLLRRTVLYKVGHHASHNATLRERGLELMNSSDLVAMIPVDQDFAEQRFRWKMPFASLMRRLEEKTRGRIIRSDRGVSKQRPQHISHDDWQGFLDRLDVGPSSDDELWISYTVVDEQS